MNFFRKIDYENTSSSIICDNHIYSYKDLFYDIKNFNFLADQKSLVFIISENNYECLAAYSGVSYFDSVVLLLDQSIKQEALNNLINKFKPSYIFQNTSRMTLGNWEVVFEFGVYCFYSIGYVKDYSIYKDLSLLLPTSGTTGSPKCVRLSYSNIYSNTVAICSSLNISSSDKVITTLPMSYSYGLSIINTHLFSNSSLILTNLSFAQRAIWDKIKSLKVTTFGGVPYTYKLLKKLKFSRLNIDSLDYITQAGGKIDYDTLNYFTKVCKEKKIKFFVMYGQTEASPRMSFLPPKMIETKAGSIGTPIQGGKFSLLKDKNDEEGELVYEGENVCMGYAFDKSDLKKKNENNGVLKTGDIAKVDKDGFYFITGRKKRILKLYGNRLNLDFVENEIQKQGLNCVCLGNDTELKIFTTNKNYVKDINNYLINKLNVSKYMFNLYLVKKIPRNSSGKIIYSQIEESNSEKIK
ncbi:MAG: hypothetical protein CBE24_04655 [bacterium TMED264]|nr:MAG: hypothetical protein CBE24_04655 [bacterium TMED264]